VARFHSIPRFVLWILQTLRDADCEQCITNHRFVLLPLPLAATDSEASMISQNSIEKEIWYHTKILQVLD
jgi:hypothetical protein